MKRPAYFLGEEWFFDGSEVVHCITIPDAVFPLIDQFATDRGHQLPVVKKIKYATRIVHEIQVRSGSEIDQKLKSLLEEFLSKPNLKELMDCFTD